MIFPQQRIIHFIKFKNLRETRKLKIYINKYLLYV